MEHEANFQLHQTNRLSLPNRIKQGYQCFNTIPTTCEVYPNYLVDAHEEPWILIELICEVACGVGVIAKRKYI